MSVCQRWQHILDAGPLQHASSTHKVWSQHVGPLENWKMGTHFSEQVLHAGTQLGIEVQEIGAGVREDHAHVLSAG